jgi:hypothetical protein
MPRATTLLCFALLAACGDFPTAGDPPGGGGYPPLLPFDDLLADVPQTEDTATAAVEERRSEDEALLDRAATLRSRADELLATSP